MADRLTLATAWLSGCSGCHVSLLDSGTDLLRALDAFDIVYSPLVDFKDTPASVDVAVVEGAVSNDHDVELVRALREAATTFVALGTCATYGGMTGMRNLLTPDEMRAAVYEGADGDMPDPSQGLMALEPRVRAIPQVVKVDHCIPGCPPLSSTIIEALEALASGEVPSYPQHNLCHECARVKEQMLVVKREFITDNVYAPFELETIDRRLCFLEQGVICMGPVTREGCGTPCVQANMPCRGCWGPAVEAMGQGAKLIDALAPVLPAGAMMYLDDLVGTGYRYSLAVSTFQGVAVGDEGDAIEGGASDG